MVDILFKQYAAKALSFETLVRYAERFSARQPKVIVAGILGRLAVRAIHFGPPPRAVRGSDRAALRQIACDIVDLGHNRDGTPVTDMFVITADLMTALGVALTDSQIRTWYYKDSRKPT